MNWIDEDLTVRAQYASELPLQTRQSVWRPDALGRTPADVALAAVVTEGPRDVLEVGCGTGHFAARLRSALPAAHVVATDQSPRMVELAAARGVDARVADLRQLPFGDATKDVIVAMWMLYHVPDLPAALTECRRVLRAGGLLVAVTNGDQHLSDLLREAGGEPLRTSFSSENGQRLLETHFALVERVDLATRAVFTDHAAAVAYLCTFDEELSRRLPWFDGERIEQGATTVFTARASRPA